jgi:hypothetical protein
MDIAPKYSGSASGMMNFGFGLAGIVAPFVFGYLIDRTGSLDPAVLRLDFPLAARHRPGVPNAPGSTVRAGRGRAGHCVIMAPRDERSPQATHCCAARTKS